MDRRFRFGVVAVPNTDGPQWRALARRTEELGYTTLLVADALHLLAPTAAVATAAAVTDTLRLGTFVLASTLRPPRVAAWDAASLGTLTDRRFELGIGTGNPMVNQAVVDEVGLAPTTAAQRLDRVRQTVADLRALETSERTPVMIAAGGPKARALAGQVADIVTFAHDPLADEATVRGLIREVHDAAGDRADEIELVLNAPVIGDSVWPPLVPLVGDDVEALTRADSQFLLRGTPQQMADTIQRRRDTFGYSYVIVNAHYLDVFAPVVEILKGR